MKPMKQICSKCQEENDRDGQRYCSGCHAEYMRDWRKRQAVQRVETMRAFNGLKDIVDRYVRA